MTVIITICMFSSKTEAQLWQALPPYNVLWPLWSPILSPADPVTGVPTPLITELRKDTVLPVQPALVWNPDLPYFYLLYNYTNYYGTTVKYWDPTEYPAIGVYNGAIWQDWPPKSLLQIINPFINTYVSIPAALSLPVGYENLITIDPYLWLNWFVPFANVAWEDWFAIDPDLLTAADLLPVDWVYSYTFGPVAPVI